MVIRYYSNDAITTGLLNNKVEIKIHLPSGQLLYHNNEKGIFIDLYADNLSEKLDEITQSLGIKLPQDELTNLNFEKLASFREYAIPATRLLENFRMTLRNNFTLIHLWPHHFDFSVEWFSGIHDVNFSKTDENGFEEFVPYVLDSVPNKPYAALATTEKEDFEGRSWNEQGKCSPVSSIRIAGEKFKKIPTTSGKKNLPDLEEHDNIYARQILAFGKEGLKKIQELKIAIIGVV